MTSSGADRDVLKPRSWLVSLLRQRCPRCRGGAIFRSRVAMNDPCPVCGLVFEREPGYFFGAMYVSYALSIVLLTPLYLLCSWLMPGRPGPLVVLVAAMLYLPFVPAVFRYSRVIWIYCDRAGGTSDLTSHAGWLKWREGHGGSPDKPE